MLSFRGYAYQESSYADGTPTPTERCYSTTSTNTPLSTVESMQWWNNGTVVDANAVSIRWHSEDFSTAPPGSHGGGEALSDTAWAGIGVGVTFGVFIAITLGMVIFLSRKKRNHQRVAKYISVQSSNDERLGGEFEKPLYFRNDPSLWSTWNAIGLDSWSYETIAVGFSVACFVAILCVLQVNLPRCRIRLTLINQQLDLQRTVDTSTTQRNHFEHSSIDSGDCLKVLADVCGGGVHCSIEMGVISDVSQVVITNPVVRQC